MRRVGVIALRAGLAGALIAGLGSVGAQAAPAATLAAGGTTNGPFLYVDSLRTAEGAIVENLPFKLRAHGATARFSPDGASLAEVFIRCDASCSLGEGDTHDSDLILRTRDGETTTVWTTDGLIRGIDWSPDGAEIAMSGGSAGASWIKVVNLPTGAVRTVISKAYVAPDFRINGGVTWHPTNGQLAFIGTRLPPPESVEAPSQVYTIPNAGGVPSLFNGAYPRFCETGPGCRHLSYGGPSWSPDGARILVNVRQSGASPSGFVGTVTAGQRDPTVLHPQGADGVAPLMWSPDGSQVLFSTAIDGVSQAVTMPATGGALKQLSSVWVSDWLPCPGGSCPSWAGADQREESSITLNYATSLARVRTNGQVTPSRPGGKVTITMQRQRRGAWITMTSKSAKLSAKSRYVIQLPYQGVFECRVTARYAGNASTKPATSQKFFSC